MTLNRSPDEPERFVEIAGAGRINKGAELMLIAAVQACISRSSWLKPAVAFRHSLLPAQRTPELRHLLRLAAPKLSSLDGTFSLLSRLVPRRILRELSMVRPNEITAILDASGFLYSDQWSADIGSYGLDYYRKWKKSNKPLVLLPQAYGPFETKAAKDLMCGILEVADRVYARDSVSVEYLSDFGPSEKIHYAPDFTNLLEVPEFKNAPTKDRVVLIPNLRLVDTGGIVSRSSYIDILTSALNRLALEGIKTAVMVHEDRDKDLVAELSKRTEAPAIYETDALRLKGYIGAARMIISARFHGLVSALSQGVPAIGIGWSHKYGELFRDYESADCLVELDQSANSIVGKVLDELEETQYHERRQLLLARSSHLKSLTDKMWNEVIAIVEESS